jgi:DNA-binding MarR family transcriptional regulator
MELLPREQLTPLCATVAAECACEGLRRAARAISKLYGGALAGVGLTATQHAILVGTRRHGSLPLSRLAGGLFLDRTSLYRAIRPLQREGYLQVLPGRNQRERVATVTAKGERILRESLPIWERTQQQFVEALGPRNWTALSSGVRQVVSVARTLESSAGPRGRRPRPRRRARSYFAVRNAP